MSTMYSICWHNKSLNTAVCCFGWKGEKKCRWCRRCCEIYATGICYFNFASVCSRYKCLAQCLHWFGCSGWISGFSFHCLHDAHDLPETEKEVEHLIISEIHWYLKKKTKKKTPRQILSVIFMFQFRKFQQNVREKGRRANLILIVSWKTPVKL